MIASAGPKEYKKSIEVLMKDPEIDSLIIIFIPIDTRRSLEIIAAIREGISEARAKGGAEKTVALCLMADHQYQKPLVLPKESVPAYQFPESAARVIAKVTRYAGWRKVPPGIVPDFPDINPSDVRSLCRQILRMRGDGWLSQQEIREILRLMNLPLPPGGVAGTNEDAVRLARSIGYPVAVKLASHKILHKTEVNALRLNVSNDKGVRKAFQEIQDQLASTGNSDAMEGVVIQPMLKGGVEVMIGMVEDPLFGPLISFGLGGIHVEILRDVSFRITPLTERDATEMIRSIKGYRLLEGYRGHPAGDVVVLEQLLLRVSRLVEEVPEIRELDFNPVFALQQGCSIVDARIRIQQV
jgi:acyl-CoA synthetase (NDP forming)